MNRVSAVLVAAMAVAVVLVAMSWRADRIGAATAGSIPIALPGARYDAALSDRLARDASAALRDGKPDSYQWEHCTDRVAVLAVSIPPGAAHDWRSNTIDSWATSTGWRQLAYK